MYVMHCINIDTSQARALACLVEFLIFIRQACSVMAALQPLHCSLFIAPIVGHMGSATGKSWEGGKGSLTERQINK